MTARSRIAVLVFAVAVAGIVASPVSAASEVPKPADTNLIQTVPIQTEVQVPGEGVNYTAEGIMRGRVRDLADYFGVIYNFLISIVGVLAASVMMIGGFQYLTAGGDQSKVAAGKKRIIGALIGMLLALTSYVLLATINPALITFKVPGVGQVGTELAILPWCEDVGKEQGATLNPPKGGSDCGNIGTYTAKNGSGTQYCVYYGGCSVTGERDNTQTCMQDPGLDPKTLGEMQKTNAGQKVGRCVACKAITKTSATQELGYPTLEDACRAWMMQVNTFRAREDNQQFWSYCAPRAKDPECVQVDIDCQAVNDNYDADFTSSANDFPGDTHSSGCQGYDDSPNERWSKKDSATVEQADMSGSGDELDDFPLHLAGVCVMNPCKNYTDPRITEDVDTPAPVPGFNDNTLHIRKQAFISGCKDNSGTLYKVQRVIRHGDLSFDDCRNAGPYSKLGGQ